ncbi:zf-HC2 domain-containing protein [Lysinibacillus sp. fls2-241-R2A-57]|uniref:zf-HC2 domain-containing protein n=1 Tax=Lysinibacillus sp. fls2-241-R2A-57 TaxID=3040292 RepID=UPI002555B8AD|nr:zf-HC2 domain-containing protein [Lysinibacillus sp. fls2-241-R2A-57]
MNCNIIKDLLPSYIDGICSEDTTKVVEEHLNCCEECRLHLDVMEQPTTDILPEEVIVAKAPFKKINKKRRIQVLITILITFSITIIGSLVVQEVGAVNQIFFPMSTATVNLTDDKDEWTTLYFDDKDYLKFDSVFWNKEIVNHANSNSDVILRIKDENGHVVVDEFKLSPGKSVKLDELKNNIKYSFELKAKKGQFLINVV